MNMLDLVNRAPVPLPWDEGDNIPWDDPDFSRRMLAQHLDQRHDRASRRSEKIDEQVQWIHNEVLNGRPTRVLDLGCGPGLYTSRLARLGHECVGIDFSPSSIDHARQEAQKEKLSCTYVHDDLRAADYGAGFGLVTLLFGEFNVFSSLDVRSILRKVTQALDFDGLLLLEPHTFSAVQRTGQSGPSWYSAKSGLFSEKPHLCLEERFWDEKSRTTTIRYFVIDAAARQVNAYAQTLQAYSTEDYEALLGQRGLEDIQLHPSLTGVKDPSQGDFFAIVARENAELR